MEKTGTLERAKNTAKERLSLSRSNSVCLCLCLLSLAFFASLSFPQIVVGLHASWDNDLTDDIPPKCVTFGTVAVPYFHFVVAYKFPVMGVSVDWYRVEEIPQQHIPAQAQFDNPQGNFVVPSCASLLVSAPQNWQWAVFPCLPDPIVGYALHNTNYKVTVQWRYGVYMEGARGPFQTSITIHVQNLVVASDPRKLIKWDPEHPELCDTTLSYSLQCAQRKQVTVKLKVYAVEGWQAMELSDTFIYPDRSGDTVDLTPFFLNSRLPKLMTLQTYLMEH
ncbi:MAG: hypothetical protein HZLCBSQH_002165 [Candidatus Fervidibacterota bacterium]